MSGPFSKLHHLCVVVHDIDRAQALYESVGIGPWHDYPPLGEYTELEMPDPDGFRALKYRYAWIGEQQFQLCEPGPEPTPQRRFLDEHGEASSTWASRCPTPMRPTRRRPGSALRR